MIVGYARTSTLDQVAGLEAQKRDLTQAGCEKLFAERVSSVAARDKLEACLEFVREGDVLVVTKLDRLARSTPHLLQIVDTLERKRVALRVLSMGGTEVDTRSPTGKLMLTLLGAFGAFERELMLERQREGIAKAKEDGKYKGRVPTAMRQAAEVHRLKSDGLRPQEIAARLRISRASVYRVLQTSHAAQAASAAAHG
jgi:DNA invertase Pin-like site-specific DNA recombinase